jgi:hypothetical protein
MALNFFRKKKSPRLHLKTKITSLSKKKNHNSMLQEYRLPFGLLYKNYLTLSTGFQLIYLLENLIQKIFGLNFTVKIS